MRVEVALGDSPPHEVIQAAAKELAAGRVIAIPTDTVYGLSADVSYTGAADRIFAAKKRSRDLTLPVLVADIEQALEITIGVPEEAVKLMKRFWPGDLTIVLPRNPEFVADIGSDEDTVGVRCPRHPVPRALADEVGPLATTSANLHKQPPATTAQQVVDIFDGEVTMVIDGGTCSGRPSTIVDMTGSTPKLLREGAIAFEDILSAAVQ